MNTNNTERGSATPDDNCAWSQDTWEEHDYGLWNTQCGNAYLLNVGSPSFNDMKFCCYCGKALLEIAYGGDSDED